MNVRVAWPKDAKGPVPVVVQSAFSFGKGRPGASTEKPSGRPFAAHARRGYAVAQLNFQQLAPFELITAFRTARLDQAAQIVFAKGAGDLVGNLGPIRKQQSSFHGLRHKTSPGLRSVAPPL